MFTISAPFEPHRSRILVQFGALHALGRLLLEPRQPRQRAPAVVVVVTDETVGALYGPTVREALESCGLATFYHAVAPGEGSKNLASASALYRYFSEHEVGRDGLVLALGGGVVSDLAGFAAATWMRGIDWAICPTTLEADIDAAIGGKTAVNLAGGKNLVGAFHWPELVAIDPMCLHSLDRRDVRAGLAESIKHALIASPEFLTWHEDHVEQLLSLDDAVIADLIERNIRIKGDIVQRDPFERAAAPPTGEAGSEPHGGDLGTAERMHLNFGHTFGHAIERCCGFTLRHGECVALGMLAASRLSAAIGPLPQSVVSRVERAISAVGLPARLEEPIDPDDLVKATCKDKKARRGATRFVLLEDVGRPIVRADVPEASVREAFQSLMP